MASHGTCPQPIFPQGEGYIYFAPTTLQQLYTGPKRASRHHKRRVTGSAPNRVTIDSFDIPVNSTWVSGGTRCLSILSAVAFICALIYHAVMFYYAFDTPLWLLMCWPFFLIPPIICNSICLAIMANKVSVKPNTKLVYLYVLSTMAYMAWTSYMIAISFKEGKCNEASYYSLAVSILSLATVACALEWWLAISKIMKHNGTELTVTTAIYEKYPTKKKLVITLKNNGKVVKEVTVNMEKIVQDYNINCTGQCMTGTVLLYNYPAHYWNEKYHGQSSADGSQLNAASCHYENEKLKKEGAMKYLSQCLPDGALAKDVADQDANEKLQDQYTEECETDDSSLNKTATQNNTDA